MTTSKTMVTRSSDLHGPSRQVRQGHPPRPPRRRILITLTVVVALVALAVADHFGLLLASPSDDGAYTGRSFMVLRVIDGDTLIINAPDRAEGTTSTRIRLWGVDAPEAGKSTWHPPQPAEPFADEATAMLTSILAGERIALVIEPHRTRGRHGRLLAHVLLSDDRSAAEELLKAGLARQDPRWPHRFLERFDQLELQARRAAVGLWADDNR
ncbi:MAG: thermonuclease family protein [Phycisphaerales bacterium]|nr:thermonuclease family protein [Phycisphaerales bacterium]